ncbi:twin-arginine translocation signal domain-containing protein, partial [Streptomyces yangpuensis]
MGDNTLSQKGSNGISRRGFLGRTGSIIGAVALAGGHSTPA